MKNKLLILGSIIFASISYAQVGINTEVPKATMDIVASPVDPSKIDGLIAPRITGLLLKAKDPLYVSAQTGAIVYVTEALASSATSTKTVNVTSVGYFYFDGNIWQKIMGGAIPTEPWNVAGTNTAATLNNQNIYQTGNVGIGDFSGSTPVAKFDVRGASRLGQPNSAEEGNPTIVGTNSLSSGTDNLASGQNSVAFGNNNNSSGYSSMTFGGNNTSSAIYSISSGNSTVASGNYSVATGLNTTSSGQSSFSTGNNNIASGSSSFAAGSNSSAIGIASASMGSSTVASSANEIVIGSGNAITSGSSSGSVLTDALFQVGNGDTSSRSNALTVLKNGNTGIGISGTEANAKPTQRLDIGSGNLRVRDINSNIAIGTERMVVADANGVLKTMNPGNYSLFHARLANNQLHSGPGITTLIYAAPLATSPLYNYNATTGTLTFTQPGNYLVTMQASFTDTAAGTQLLVGIRPVPDANYLARGSHYTAVANTGTIGELMNYSTMIIVPTANYQIRFTVGNAANSTILANETGSTGTGNVTNVTIQKI